MTERNEIRDAAVSALRCGLSIVPPMEDGSKRPIGTWKAFQSVRPTQDDLEGWYGPESSKSKLTGLGIVCGVVSHGLEAFEFDDGGKLYEPFRILARAIGYGELIERLDSGYAERSPSGGIHWLYFCEKVSGNTDLAKLESGKASIQTRGEGGYIVTAPSWGKVHPTGKPYQLIAGGFDTIPTITPEERSQLWDLARSYDDTPEPESSPVAPPSHLNSRDRSNGDISPGDDLNTRGTWSEILSGWTKVFIDERRITYWRRPGKSSGWSATTNSMGTDRLKVFTSSTVLVGMQTYSKFGAYAAIHHGGDFSIAARTLRELGYGGTDDGKQLLKVNGKICYTTPREAMTPEDDDEDQIEDDEEKTLGKSGREYKFPLIQRGSEVKAKPVDWLWEDFIPRGFLTLFVGQTSSGKTFVALDLVARMSIQGEIPLSGGECFPLTSTLILSEDPVDVVLVPRLIVSGADMNRINFMSWQAMAEFTLSDSEMLGDTWAAAGSPGIVIIDPPTNFLNAKDEHKNAEVRSILMHVAGWAGLHKVACILITHTNKGSKKDMAALDRIIGSVAWATTSRIAHMFGSHPENEGEKLFTQIKTNIGEVTEGLSYTIERIAADNPSNPLGWKLAKVKYKARYNGSADDALAGKRRPRGLTAADWVTQQFRIQKEWLATEIKSNAREYGISENSLKDPYVMALSFDKEQRHDAFGKRFWVWVAHDGWPPE